MQALKVPGVLPFVWVGLVFVVACSLLVSVGSSGNLAWWQVVGLAVPVHLVWGSWAAGFLLARKRREATFSALRSFSAWARSHGR